MTLPRQRNQKGQILIIFLLVLVVGVAIVLSIASRSITDIRTTTTSDESNRAYFAAEAGVESALKKISSTTGTTSFSLDFNAVNQTTAKVDAKPLAASGTFPIYASPTPVSRDDVFQISLLDDFNVLPAAGNLGTAGDYLTAPAGANNRITIYWDDNASSVDSALEVTLLYRDASSVYNTAKWAFDQQASTHSNRFCTGGLITSGGNQTSGNLGTTVEYKHQVTLSLDDGSYVGSGTDCTQSTAGIMQSVLMRIKPLYNTSPTPIAVGPASGRSLPQQGFEVESSGSTVSGVTRKLRVIQPYPALPAIFDYVLFNGSSNPLTK